MKKTLLTLTSIALLTTGCTQATQSLTPTPMTKSVKSDKVIHGEKQLQAVHAFIQNHLIGKTLGYEIKKKYRRNTKYVDVKYILTYDGLERTAKGIKFQEKFTAIGTKWNLDANGNKIGEGKKIDRIGTRYYEVSGNGYDDNIHGFMQYVPKSAKDMTGKNMRTLRVLKVEDGKLNTRHNLTNYGACTAPEGSKRAGASESESVFEVINGKVRKTNVLTRYEVNTKTFERKICKEKPTMTTVANEL